MPNEFGSHVTEHSQESMVAGPAAELSRRYATALYALAAERSVLDSIAHDLQTLKDCVVKDPSFRCLAEHPRLSIGSLMAAASKIAQFLRLDPLTERFLIALARRRRLGVLAGIIETFLNRRMSEKGELVATVASAQALTDEQQDKLTAALAKHMGGRIVHLALRVDPSLLGGITVLLGPTFIDASVKGRLARLERALKFPMTQKGAA